MSQPTETPFNLDAEAVIGILRRKIESLEWANTLLEARCQQAEKINADLLKNLSDRSAPANETVVS